MKKLMILIVVLITISYSCKKNGKEVSTTISGHLRTNGTESVIKMSPELSLPKIDIYHVYWTGKLGTGGSDTYEIISSTPVNSDGSYSITLDLNSNDEYFIGFSNIDESVYWPNNYSFYTHDENAYNQINIGGTNNINLYCSATSWIQPRFINTNPNANNNDKFQYITGIGGGGGPTPYDPIFTGSTDTIMSWIKETWSGTYREGVINSSFTHKVEAKLTRNGITKDTSIIYTAPPFDTTVVEIRY